MVLLGVLEAVDAATAILFTAGRVFRTRTPVEAELTEGLLRENVGVRGVGPAIRITDGVVLRDVVDVLTEELLAEGDVVSRVDDELVPRVVDWLRRDHPIRHPGGAAEIEELLEVAEHLLSLFRRQAELVLEPPKELRMLVAEHTVHQRLARRLRSRTSLHMRHVTFPFIALWVRTCSGRLELRLTWTENNVNAASVRRLPRYIVVEIVCADAI